MKLGKERILRNPGKASILFFLFCLLHYLLFQPNNYVDLKRIFLSHSLSHFSEKLRSPRLRPQDVELWEECMQELPKLIVPDALRRSRRANLSALATGKWKSISGKDFPRVPALSDFEIWLRTLIEPVTPFSR